MGSLLFNGDLADTDARSVVYRRRPGRLEAASPALIPVFHGKSQCSLDLLHFPLGDADPLRAARGLGAALLCSVLLWGLLLASVWFAFRAIW